MGVLFLDCGTGESKLIFIDEVSGEISFDDLSGEKDKLPAVQTLLESKTKQDEFFRKFEDQVNAFRDTGRSAKLLHCGLTAWYRAKNMETRQKYDQFFEHMERIVSDILQINLRKDTLAGFTEARYEHAAVTYAAKYSSLGLWRLDLVISGGSGSVQITASDVYGIDPLSFDLPLKDGVEIVENEGLDAYITKVQDEIFEYVHPFTEMWDHDGCILPGNIICISSFFHAAKAAGLCEEGPKQLDLQVVLDKLDNLIYDSKQASKNRANAIRVREIFKLLFSEYDPRKEQKEDAKIIFARDWKINKNDFRTTWTTGCFMDIYAQVPKNKPKQPSGKFELGDLGTRLQGADGGFVWCNDTEDMTEYTGLFENKNDGPSQGAPCFLLNRLITVRSAPRDLLRKARWNKVAVGTRSYSRESAMIQFTIFRSVPVVVGFFTSSDAVAIPNPRMGYSRRQNSYGPCIDFGINLTRDGQATIQIGSMHIPEVPVFPLWFPNTLYHCWLEFGPNPHTGVEQLTHFCASAKRSPVFRMSITDMCRKARLSETTRQSIANLQKDQLFPCIWVGNVPGYKVDIQSPRVMEQLLDKMENSMLQADVKVAHEYLHAGSKLLGPSVEKLKEIVKDRKRADVTFDQPMHSGPSRESNLERVKQNQAVEAKIKMMCTHSKLPCGEWIKWQIAYARYARKELLNAAGDLTDYFAKKIFKSFLPRTTKASLERGHIEEHCIRDISTLSRAEIIATAQHLGCSLDDVAKLPFSDELVCSAGMDSLLCIWSEIGDCFAIVDFRKLGIKELWSCTFLPPMKDSEGDLCLRIVVGIDNKSVHVPSPNDETDDDFSPQECDRIKILTKHPMQEVVLKMSLLNTTAAVSVSKNDSSSMKTNESKSESQTNQSNSEDGTGITNQGKEKGQKKKEQKQPELKKMPSSGSLIESLMKRVNEKEDARLTKGLCALRTKGLIPDVKAWGGGGKSGGGGEAHKHTVTRIIRHPGHIHTSIHGTSNGNNGINGMGSHYDDAPNVMFTTSYDRKALRWDCQTRKVTGVMGGDSIGGHKEKIMNGAVSTCGNYFATTGFDCAISVWNVTPGQEVSCLRRVEGFPDRLMAVTFFPTHMWEVDEHDSTANAGGGGTHRPMPTSMIVGDVQGFLFLVKWSNNQQQQLNETSDVSPPRGKEEEKVLKLDMENAYSSSSHCAQFFKHGAAVRKLCTLPEVRGGKNGKHGRRKSGFLSDDDDTAYLISSGQDKKVKLLRFSSIEQRAAQSSSGGLGGSRSTTYTNRMTPMTKKEAAEEGGVVTASSFAITFHLTDIRGLALSSAQAGRLYSAGYTMCRWDDLRDPEMKKESNWFTPSMEFRPATLSDIWDIPSVFAIGMVQLSMIVYEHVTYYTVKHSSEDEDVLTASFFFPLEYPKAYAERLHLGEWGIAALTVLVFAIVMIGDIHTGFQNKITELQRKYVEHPQADLRAKEQKYTNYRAYVWLFLFACASVLPVPFLQALSSTFRCIHAIKGDETSPRVLLVYPSVECKNDNMDYYFLMTASISLLVFYALLFAPLIMVNNDARMLGYNYVRNIFYKLLCRLHPKSWQATLKRVEITPYGTYSIISKQLMSLKLAQVSAMLALPIISDSFSIESNVFSYSALGLSTAILLASLVQNPARYSRFRFFFIWFALIFWWSSVILFTKDQDIQFLKFIEPLFENVAHEDTAVKIVFWGGQAILLLICSVGFKFVGDRDSSVPKDTNMKNTPSLATGEKDPLLSDRN